MVEIVYGEFIQVKSEAEKYFECYRFSKIRCYLNILTRIQLIQLAYPFYIEATRTYAHMQTTHELSGIYVVWILCTTG